MENYKSAIILKVFVKINGEVFYPAAQSLPTLSNKKMKNERRLYHKRPRKTPLYYLYSSRLNRCFYKKGL